MHDKQGTAATVQAAARGARPILHEYSIKIPYRQFSMKQKNDGKTHPGDFLPVNNLKIYYEQYGSGTPLILLHGATATGAIWRPYIPALSNQFRVIIPDARGHGQSSSPAGPIRLRHLSDDVWTLIQALNLDRPFLFGWSTGADTALELAMRHPDALRGLIIGGVVLRTSDSYFQSLHALGIEGPGQVNFERAEKTIPDLIKILQMTHTQKADHWKTLISQLSDELSEPTLPPVGGLQNMHVPTLIIWGDRDEFLPVEDALALYRLLPNAELAVLPLADHGVTRTRVDAVSDLGLEFLLRHMDQGSLNETEGAR